MLQEYFLRLLLYCCRKTMQGRIFLLFWLTIWDIPILAASRLPEDIKKYENTYKEGWDIIREEL